MTILYGYNTAINAWVPVDHAERLCYLLLKAQRLEAAGIETMFVIGANYEFFMAEDPRNAPV